MEHLHKNGIIYRDIKLENILLDEDGHIILTDFGLSREFAPHEQEKRAYSFCGTIEYMAPEVVKGGNHGHDIAVDWWSLGVLTYELLTGASPFTVEGDRNTQQDISHRILNAEPMMPDFLTGDVKDFILKLLVKDPRKRLGGDATDATAVKNHKFFVPSINWDDLLRKNIPAPFIPRISTAMDVSNFSEEFTNMPAVDSPSIAPPNVENVFSGYSYVAPSVVLEHYVTTVPTASNVPSLPLSSSSKDSLETSQEHASSNTGTSQQKKLNAHQVILTPEQEEQLFRPNPDKRPSASNLVGCKLKVG